MSTLKIIGMKSCPFVQRSVALMVEKGIEYNIEYIDVENPPQWFEAISPMGQVPVLLVDNKPLFESSIICDYLDEISPPSIHPADAFEKAQNRAWVEFTTNIYICIYKMMMAKNKEAFEEQKDDLSDYLEKIAEVSQAAPWFNGTNFSMVDIAMASAFIRVAIFKKHFNLDLLEGFENLTKWSNHTLKYDSVKRSIVDDLEVIMLKRMQSNKSYLIAA